MCHLEVMYLEVRLLLVRPPQSQQILLTLPPDILQLFSHLQCRLGHSSVTAATCDRNLLYPVPDHVDVYLFV